MAGGGGSSTQRTEPPKYLQPFLQEGMGAARDEFHSGPDQYYPGQTVVGFSPETEQALGMQSSRAMAGSPITASANSYAANTLAGTPPNNFGSGANPYASSAYSAPGSPNPFAANTYQNPTNNFGAGSNPALDSMFNKAASSTQTRLASEFAGSGRNIDASRPARAEELENLATGIYGGAYENERGRELDASLASAGRGLDAYLQGQQIGASSYESDLGRRQEGAMAGQQIGATGYEAERDRMAQEQAQNRQLQLGVLGLSPQLAQSDYTDIDRLRAVGGAREELTGRQYEDAAARYDFGQQAPGLALDQYLGRLQGYPGSQTSTPVYSNPMAGAAGGAMLGNQIGGQYGYGGWGALAGGLLGAYGG